MTRDKEPWRNRIVGYGEIDPEEALANDLNWRIHGRPQGEAIDDIMGRVGVVQNIIINKRTSEEWPAGERNVETLLDGHLRIQRALARGQKRLPVTYVDLTPAEEREVLAVLDPIGAMATTDRDAYQDLIADVEAGSEVLDELMAHIAGEGDRPSRDRELEEIDIDTLPVKPVWALCAIPTHLLPTAQPLLDELAALGIQVEVSDG